MIKLTKGDILENILIEEALSEGKSLARYEGIVLFVEGAVPGDVIDAVVTYRKKNFTEVKVKSFLKKSEEHIEPFCDHFSICGGCKWQHFAYTGQLRFKQKQVVDALTRIGKIEIKEILPILSSSQTRYYRNRLDFAFSNKKWLTNEELGSLNPSNQNALGFHIPKRFDKVLDIKT
jgi:23S rRNA (uracil1939-C5)-methyltransferase